MPFEGPTPAKYNNEQVAAETIKQAEFFTFRQLLAEKDDLAGTNLAGLFQAAADAPAGEFNPVFLNQIPEESGMRQRAFELIAQTPEYVAYTEKLIQSATSTYDLAEHLQNLPGIVTESNEFYSGQSLSEIITYVSDRFLEQFAHHKTVFSVEEALNNEKWVSVVALNGMLPPHELGLRGAVTTLLQNYLSQYVSDEYFKRREQEEVTEAERLRRFQNPEDAPDERELR